MDDLFSVFGETTEPAATGTSATTSQPRDKPQKRNASKISTKHAVPVAKKKKKQSTSASAITNAPASVPAATATAAASAAAVDAGAAKQDTDAKGRKKPQRQDWMIERTVIINGGSGSAKEGVGVVKGGVGTQSKNCIHECAFPPSFSEADVEAAVAKLRQENSLPSPMAKEFSYTLDPFQRQSVCCIERLESVLVAAHTSAGKTSVAEYAIALSLKNKQRVIYTSPIKALSNQKYRDLAEEFSDVGLMTGDVTISPNASCLVMTTEVLRSMLYRGSEVLREVAWVIYDEIHYMRDKERGVVWEESIIMLPHSVRFVFLSATIPNAKQFAGWIAATHDQPCHVLYTEYRPTPLQHYMFPSGGAGLHLVVNEHGKFLESNFQKAVGSLATSVLEAQLQDQMSEKDARKKRRDQKKKTGGDLFRIISMIMDKHYDPVIVFSFSKKECEAYALALSKLDLITEEEKGIISEVFSNAIESLSEDDRKLPQVEAILPLLKRGIGIHHGGLLPILKEIIEILFGEGLLKCLFATETFAMGINMPAKTVVFTSARKFDGTDFRIISAGEYIQMSGRAGRRGLDDRGLVIQMLDEKLDPVEAKGVLKGVADPLNSTFHLGYNMLLNLLRVEDADPEFMMRHSFHQFQMESGVADLQKKKDGLEVDFGAAEVEDEAHVVPYFRLSQLLDKENQKLKEILFRPENILPFLNAGRLVSIKDGDIDWGVGVVVKFDRRFTDRERKNVQYIVQVLLKCKVSSAKPGILGLSKPQPCPKGERGVMQVVPCFLHLLNEVYTVRVYLPKTLRSSESRAQVLRKVEEVQKRLTLQPLDAEADFDVQEKGFRKLVTRLKDLRKRLVAMPLHSDPRLADKFRAYAAKMKLKKQITQTEKEIKKKQTLAMKGELKKMKRVLRRLGHTDDDNVIQIKGRVACEINTADELVVTELIFAGVFNELTVEQAVALLSAFVFSVSAKPGGKGEPGKDLRKEIQKPFRQLQDAARRVAKVMHESRLEIDVDEFVGKFSTELMEVAYVWATGAKFADICQMTELFEGSIIRAIRRLEELLRQLAAAARGIGNEELETKFTAGMRAIKRDIIFAASLYL